MSKDLMRLVYRSRSTLHPDNVEELDKIFRTSLANNVRKRLTGCLAHPDGHFVQVVEGQRTDVEDLLVCLRADNRHTEIEVLGRWNTPARLFTGWAMARPDLRPLKEQSLNLINEVGSGAQVTTILMALIAESADFYTLL